MTEKNETYLTVNQVAARFGVSRDTIYRWKREGKFPMARKLSKGSTRWLLSDVVDWEETLEVGFATHLHMSAYPRLPVED